MKNTDLQKFYDLCECLKPHYYIARNLLSNNRPLETTVINWCVNAANIIGVYKQSLAGTAFYLNNGTLKFNIDRASELLETVPWLISTYEEDIK